MKPSEMRAEIERLTKLTIRQRATINRLQDENCRLTRAVDRLVAETLDIPPIIKLQPLDQLG